MLTVGRSARDLLLKNGTLAARSKKKDLEFGEIGNFAALTKC